MKRKLFIVLLLFPLALWAHDDKDTITFTFPRIRLGVEAGITSFWGKINKPAQIRENQSYYYDYDYDYNGGFISEQQGFQIFYFGLKPEYQFNDRITMAAGLRFSINNLTLYSDRNYFLWKISETETNTNYVKISEIRQKNYFVGVPIEARVFTNPKDFAVRHYFIVGMAFNCLLVSANDVDFPNAAMIKYTSDVLSHIEKPSGFHGQFYAGCGLKIGKAKNPFGNIEFHLPIYMFGKDEQNSFAKMNETFGFGFQTTLQIPIFREQKVTYIVID